MPGFHQFLAPDELLRLDRLALGSRRAAGGGRSGHHRSPLKGASIEFTGHRNYVQGDNLRHLDWKVHARSDRFFIKEFLEETNLRVTLLLDASASMAFSHAGRPQKFACARKLAAAIAYLAQLQQDAVGLVLYDHAIRACHMAKSGPRHLLPLLDSLAACQPTGASNTKAALHSLAPMLSRRGLLILLSDLLDAPEDIFAALAHFRRHGHDIMLWQILDPAELDLPFDGASDFIDMESGAHLEVDPRALRQVYHATITAAIDTCRARCGALHVDYQLFTTDTAPLDFLQTVLAARRHAKPH